MRLLVRFEILVVTVWNVAIQCQQHTSVLSQESSNAGVDLGGGVVTRTNVEWLADITLDIRDMAAVITDSGGSSAAMEIYLDGKNSEPQVGTRYRLSQLSSDLANAGVSKATPPYLFHLYGLSDRSLDVNKLAEHLSYADGFVRGKIMASAQEAPMAALVLNVWMYAVHRLYSGMDTCQKIMEADNAAQFNLGTAGFDEFIALYIGTGQSPGSADGTSLYALAEETNKFFEDQEHYYYGDINYDTFNPEESTINTQIKSLYQEAMTILSVPGVCTSDHPESVRTLWSIVNQIVPLMYVPILRNLVLSILRKDSELTQIYSMAIVPQAAQCRPSVYKRLKEYLMGDNPKFDRSKVILRDLQDIYACFGITCDDIGVLNEEEIDLKLPDCFAADDRAPMADYYPTSDVHPIASIDLDVLQIRILTELGSFGYAKFWYLYGRNSPVQRDSENDPFQFYSLADLAVATSRRNADPIFSEFVRYFNDNDYAHTLVRNTLDGKGKWGSSRSTQQRSAVITESCAFLILYMHLIAQINDAVNECRGNDKSDVEGMYDLTHPWDEVAALIIGSLEGTDEGGSSDVQDGQLIWGLSTQRGFQFQTLNGQGYARLNSRLEDLLYAGKGEIDAQYCDEFQKTAETIKGFTMIPLMQSILRYAIQNQQQTDTSASEDVALGEILTLSILPIMQAVDPTSASVLEKNMITQDGAQPVSDGAQQVADAIGNFAVAYGLPCRLLGSTPQANPCRLHGSSAYSLRPLVYTSVAALAASLFFML